VFVYICQLLQAKNSKTRRWGKEVRNHYFKVLALFSSRECETLNKSKQQISCTETCEIVKKIFKILRDIQNIWQKDMMPLYMRPHGSCEDWQMGLFLWTKLVNSVMHKLVLSCLWYLGGCSTDDACRPGENDACRASTLHIYEQLKCAIWTVLYTTPHQPCWTKDPVPCHPLLIKSYCYYSMACFFIKIEVLKMKAVRNPFAIITWIELK
jgi:hypothetical protein